MPIVIEEADEFIARHSKEGPMIRLSPGKWLLPTGATLTNNGIGPTCYEPPADPKARLTLRRQYFTKRAERAEGDFKLLKGALTGGKDHNGLSVTYTWDEKEFGPAPGRDGPTALLKLKDIARQHRNAVADIDRAIADLPSERLRVAEEQRQAAIAAEIKATEAERRAEVEAITLD